MSRPAAPASRWQNWVRALAGARYGWRMAITHQWIDGEIVLVCETMEDFVEALEQDLPIVAPDELAAAFPFLDLPQNGDPLPDPASSEIREE